MSGACTMIVIAPSQISLTVGGGWSQYCAPSLDERSLQNGFSQSPGTNGAVRMGAGRDSIRRFSA